MGVLSDKEGAGNIPYQKTHLKESKVTEVIAACAVLSALSSIAILLRVLVRLRTNNGFKADDYTIFVTLVFAWGSFVSIYYETQSGLGHHTLAVKPSQIKTLIRALLFEAPTFQIAVMFNQLSLLFLYKRVFTLRNIWFRNSLIGLGIFCIGTGLALFFAGLFHCVPLNYGWNKKIKGRCDVNIQALYITATVLNLVGDIGIVAAPIPLIWSLQMSPPTKVGVTGMFLLGGFVTIINVIKLHSIVVVPVEDFTWYDVPVATWTHASLCLGIVSACLPCYRPLVRDFYLKIKSKAKKSSEESPHSSSHTKGSKGTASDQYKTLDGKESDTNGSNIALVTRDEWVSSPGGNTMAKSIAEGGAQRKDIELGLNPHAIGVRKDVDVSSFKVQQ